MLFLAINKVWKLIIEEDVFLFSLFGRCNVKNGYPKTVAFGCYCEPTAGAQIEQKYPAQLIHYAIALSLDRTQEGVRKGVVKRWAAFVNSLRIARTISS